MKSKDVFRSLILTLALIIFSHPSFASPQSVNYLIEFGKLYYHKQYYNLALTEFSKVLILEPDNPIAQKYLKVIRSDIIASALEDVEGKQTKEIHLLPPDMSRERTSALTPSPKVNVSGSMKMSLGLTVDEMIFAEANGDLTEKNWRLLSDTALNKRGNTYDPAIFDRLSLNLDTLNPEGLNFHTNITVDPWSFIGKSERITIGSGGGASDFAEVQLKYWSNSGYTINETVYTLEDGGSIALPEIKVVNGRALPTTVTTSWTVNLSIPELKIKKEFLPLREIWFDYKKDEINFKFFPLAYESEALTSDDPLGLSNHHIWWEESPWLDAWRPGILNTTPGDFTPGEWDDALSFFTRDSDLKRLTNLRGLSFNWNYNPDSYLKTSIASPKGLWQDYDSFTTFPAALRLRHLINPGLSLGSTYTSKLAYDENKKDAENSVLGLDMEYLLDSGIKVTAEVAGARSQYDRRSNYSTKLRGNVFQVSLISSSEKDIFGLRYDEIKPPTDKILPQGRLSSWQGSFRKNKQKDIFSFFKGKATFTRMDEGFEAGLATYRETRDDAFWSRHINFRRPFGFYYSGLSSPLSWEDIQPFRLGDGIDRGRDTLSLRLEGKGLEERLEGLFDLRNVHATDGKYIETVSRMETTYRTTEKLTSKFLGIYQDLPKTKGGKDPFIFDTDTGLYLNNAAIGDGQDPSLKTGSFGLEYAFSDNLALSGIWERTNDSTVATDDFPRGLLNSASFRTEIKDGKTFRYEDPYLYSQGLFPLPPYNYYDIFKVGLRFMPQPNLEIYLDAARNEFKSAGQIDDNINHIGLELGYRPQETVDMFFRYSLSWTNNLYSMVNSQDLDYGSHHNLYGSLRYHIKDNEEFVTEYGVGISPHINSATTDPFGGSLASIDTQHILRMYYYKNF